MQDRESCCQPGAGLCRAGDQRSACAKDPSHGSARGSGSEQGRAYPRVCQTTVEVASKLEGKPRVLSVTSAHSRGGGHTAPRTKIRGFLTESWLLQKWATFLSSCGFK